MRIRDFINSKINEVENTEFWRPWETRNYAMTGGEVCDNIRWCELRSVLSEIKVLPIIERIWHIKDNPCVRSEIRQYIANKLAINVDRINTDIKIPVGNFNSRQGVGDFREASYVKNSPLDIPKIKELMFWTGEEVGSRWDIYNIGYNYREPAPEVANSILNEIAPILDIISEISSYQSSNSGYLRQIPQKTQEIARNESQASQKEQEIAQKERQVSQKSQEVARKEQEVSQKNQEIAQKNREITEVQQKIAGLQSQENSLQSQINSFQIGDNIKALNAKQKAHILQKLWGNGDADSVSVINAIKQYGFDPHYVHKNGQSLTQLALSKNDTALFDLLIANKIDFNISNANLTIFKLVLDSGNSNFISKMFATGQDFTKSLLDVVLKDDAVMLDKIFSHKAELSQVSYSGYSLLQLALKHGCYKSAEQILRSNPQAINQLTTKGLSALQLAVLTDDKPGIELLKKFGANFELELKNAISQNYGKNVTKISETNPELLNKLEAQGNSPLYHALLQNKLAIAESLLNKGADSKIVIQKALAENNLQMIKDLVALNADSTQLIISDSKNALYLH
ncbi:hypothetical protein [Candidatus Tisiphia endosymbiont of Ceraclea dissimilis]|uniref:hypothetical protein n=1 Tax=Candidatus Tisiphia endosymbiont of Ceraclea dissimilis TaxID=3077928 RepID=UPI003CCAFEC5